MLDPVAVLGLYPTILRRQLEPLGDGHGFSGACLWRSRGNGEVVLCLRAAAPHETLAHLVERHRLMALARQAGLTFVPAVFHTSNSETVVRSQGRLWELMEWLPGRADYHDAPTPGRLRSAAQALARVHQVWRPGVRSAGACPAIVRRLRSVETWQDTTSRAHPLQQRLRGQLDRWMPEVSVLARPACESWELQPCLRDVWHDHLLFTDEALTGLVDYAAVGVDNVAADLARMLGSLVEDDEERWRQGLAAYREVRSLSLREEQLARLLDRTGVVAALGNWYRWLGEPDRTMADHAVVVRRVERLLARTERWSR